VKKKVDFFLKTELYLTNGEDMLIFVIKNFCIFESGDL